MSEISNERLLGTLVAEIRAINDRTDRTDDQIREDRIRAEAELRVIRKDVQELKDYMIRVEGGRRVLFALLAVAATLGGFIWEVISRLLPYLSISGVK